MRSESMLHLLIIGPKRLRVRIANVLRGTPGWRFLRACYRACSLLWNNAVVRSVTDPVRRQLYAANPRAYWQHEGGDRYLADEAFLLGVGSLTEHQGGFLATELQALGATSVLEVGCGYGRMLKELQRRLDVILYGADFSETQLIAAQKYLAAKPLPLILADATEGLPFPDSAFDIVYTQGSLMHVPPPLDQAYRKELVRVTRRYVLHTEQFKDSVHVFAHNNEGQYRVLGHRLVKAVSYPFNPPGQQMTFQVFEIRKH